MSRFTNLEARGKALEIIAVLESRTNFYIVWEQHTDVEQESIIQEIVEVIQHEGEKR